jgi:hypothetical protein
MNLSDERSENLAVRESIDHAPSASKPSMVLMEINDAFEKRTNSKV